MRAEPLRARAHLYKGDNWRWKAPLRRFDAARQAGWGRSGDELAMWIQQKKTRFTVPVLIRLLGTGLLVLAFSSDLLAADRPRGGNAEAVSEGTVSSIVDGDTLLLASGAEIRLVGIQAPKLPLGRRNFRPWPLAEDSKRALEALAAGRRLRLSYGGRRMDRHGRLLAHLTIADGKNVGQWIQGALLEAGMARVYSFPDNRSRVADMLTHERAARAARRGIWAHPFYAIRTPETAARHIGTFQLVEGRIVGTATVRGRGYLNFGDNWKTDFTVSISPRTLRRHWQGGPDIANLKGKRVRVRGWLKSYNGPLIEATHPEQIEILP